MDNTDKNKYTDQDSLLELQKSISSKGKFNDILLTVLSLVIIFGFSAAIWLVPDKDFSEEENRALQSVPKFTVERLIDGRFTSDIAKYYADQFPARDIFVGAKAVSEIYLFGKRENNSVISAKDGYVIERSDEPSKSVIEENTKALTDFAEKCSAAGVKFTAVAAPRVIDAMYDSISSPAPDGYTDEIRESLSNGLSSVKYVDLYDTLSEKISSGEQIYYRTDHHWTTLGAYYGYEKIMSALALSPRPKTDFTPELASSEFYGTTWSSAGMKWVAPDEMYFYRYDGDESFRLVFEGKEETAKYGFYDLDYLSKKDKYGAFLSGNNGRVTVTLESSEPREKILVIKDSFAHALIPFLAMDFDIEMIDLRYYKGSVTELMKSGDFTRVIAIYNYDSYVTENAFNLLYLD